MPALRMYSVAALLTALLATHAARAADRPKPTWLRDELSPDVESLPPGAFARLGSARLKHPDAVTDVALSDDGRTIASVSFDRLVLWDAATGRERRRYCCSFLHEGLRMAAGGTTVVAANESREMRLIDTATGRFRPVTLPGKGAFSAVAASPDGAVVAAVHSRTGQEAGEEGGTWHCRISLWDAAQARKLRELDNGPWDVVQIALSEGGKRLVDLRTDDRVHVWDAQAGRELRAFATGSKDPKLVQLGLSRAGDAVALVMPEEGIGVWDAETGKQRWRLEDKSSGDNCAAFSPDAKLLAVGTAGGVRLLRAADGREDRRLAEPGSDAAALAFSRDGKTLVTGGSDGRVRVWELASGRQRLAVEGHSHAASTLAFSPDGRLLASADGWRTACLWDVGAAREVRKLQVPRNFITVAFAPDGGRLAFNSAGLVTMWDPSTGRRVVSGGAERPCATCAAFTRGGRSLVCVEGSDFVWLRADTLAVERRLPGRAAGYRLAVTSLGTGGTLLATNDELGSVLVFDEAGKQVARLRGRSASIPSSIALAPDGRRAAVWLDSYCTLWDLASGAELHRWKLHQDMRGNQPTAFSADGRLLAATDDERGVRVFEVASRGEMACFDAKAGGTKALAFAPDGRTVATAEAFGPLFLWDLARPRTGEKPSAPPAAELDALWENLRGEDAGRAYRAVWRLADFPAQSVPFLRGRLRPAEALSPERVRALVTRLDAPQFAARQAAFRELSEAAELAEADLRSVNREGQSAQVGEALSKILKALNAERLRPGGDQFRALRAVQALEYMPVPEARALLERLATGAPGATLTREARAALKRAGR